MVSAATFAPGVPVVFIAAGQNFPDALAGGAAAAAEGSPVLLVRQNSIPALVATELDRLNPGRIVVLGGPAIVSDAVKTALGAYL
jgi:putative cell wall-binding protein